MHGVVGQQPGLRPEPRLVDAVAGFGGGVPRSMSAGGAAHEIAIRQERAAFLLSHILRAGEESGIVAHRNEDGARRQARVRR